MLKTVNDIKLFFSNDDTHYYFISPSSFNLLSMEKWVKNWHNVNLIDCFDGKNTSVILAPPGVKPTFTSVQEINEFLLNQTPTLDAIKKVKGKSKGKALFLFYSPELEQRCERLGLEVAMPKNDKVQHVDNKIITTKIGNQADVPSVPNVITTIENYSQLLQIAKDNSLGSDLVIQQAYGDSGKTTYFVKSEQDFSDIAHKISKDEDVKIMKHIRCISTAIEGCATRNGTFVGPLLGELIGEPTLTPYAGGWCGNEYNSALFSSSIRHQARTLTERLGNQLYAEGYRGGFEVDYLLDLDTNSVYLGELNPRITGITAITNLSEFSQAQVPLFLFHLLEFSDVEFDIDVTHFNDAAMRAGATEHSGQLILKHTGSELLTVQTAPATGVYHFDTDQQNPSLKLVATSAHRQDAKAPNEVYILRIMQKDEYAYYGADLAIVFANFPLRDNDLNLTERAQQLIQALHGQFVLHELNFEETANLERYRTSSSIKHNLEQV